ncbi:MAG: TATA-box-binding protein [Candidatus Aenigmatarchaeota archaeon]|nr:TATA-box-binding protein [Candidatus Aenigmarchaeota archaeon]MCX8178266.1 TATA-box-binding protein [Candidatus Aenigmarchaeota archaeon]
MTKFNIKIENIVASASLGVRVPLEKMIKYLEGTEYEPEQFPGLVYRVKDPKAATLIFSSGKIVCTGARSIEDVKRVVKKVIDAIKSAGIGNPTKYTVQIENIVASAKLKSTLNLDKIAFEVEESEYEPEQFPGLVLRMRNPKVAFLLFSSGKIVCTGARKIKDVESAVEMLSGKLKSIGALNE